MEFTYRTTYASKLYIWIVTFSSVYATVSSLDDVPPFPYPCYVDVCTFPGQYCNSRERRCSQCTNAICNLDEQHVPLACRYTCIKNRREETTAITTPQDEALKNAFDEQCVSMHMLMTYSAIALTVLLVLGASMCTVWVVRSKTGRRLLTPRRLQSSMYAERNIRTQEFIEDQEKRLGTYAPVQTIEDAERVIVAAQCVDDSPYNTASRHSERGTIVCAPSNLNDSHCPLPKRLNTDGNVGANLQSSSNQTTPSSDSGIARTANNASQADISSTMVQVVPNRLGRPTEAISVQTDSRSSEVVPLQSLSHSTSSSGGGDSLCLKDLSMTSCSAGTSYMYGAPTSDASASPSSSVVDETVISQTACSSIQQCGDAVARNADV